MNITVVDRSRFRRTMLDMMANFYARYLGIADRQRDLVVTVRHGLAAETGASALTWAPEPDSQIIVLSLDSKLSVAETSNAMAHEMVHVAQKVKGTLRYEQIDGACIPFWRGKRSDHLPYLQQPWERQAMASSEIMSRSFEEATFGEYKS
jgi:hypothetical protein